MLSSMASQIAGTSAKTFREFAAFLRRPELREVELLSFREKLTAGIWFFIFSMLATAAFGVLALPFLLVSDVSVGAPLQNTLDGSVWSVLLSVVLLGPIVEEIMFRGWLSGTWRATVLSLLGLAVIFGGSRVADVYLVDSGAIKIALIFAAAVLIALACSQERGVRAIPFFAKAFPVIFYLQAGVFGILHLQNYASSSVVIALLATLPLVICGTIWGYARIKLGFVSAILLHAAYNVPAALGSFILLQSTA